MVAKSNKEILGMSTLSHKFQVTIPKEVRDSQEWSEGTKILFVKEDGKVFLKKSTDVS